MSISIATDGLVVSGGAAVDVTAPAITNVTPTPGTPLAAADAVEFDVTDETGLAQVVVAVRAAANEAPEIVHDGDAFTAPYLSSERGTITGGWHYTVRRTGGWRRSSLTLSLFVVDTGGNTP